LLNSPIDVILEIAQHLEIMEPQAPGGEYSVLDYPYHLHPRRLEYQPRRSSLMSLASCNRSLHSLITPLVFRKLVFVCDVEDLTVTFSEMCETIAKVPSYTPSWLGHVKEAHFICWSENLVTGTKNNFALTLGKLRRLEKLYLWDCDGTDSVLNVIGNGVFPRHIILDRSTFSGPTLAGAWERVTVGLGDRTAEDGDRTLEILMTPSEFDSRDYPRDIIDVIHGTSRMASSLVSITLNKSFHIQETPLLLKLLRETPCLQFLAVTRAVCNLRSLYGDPENELRALREQSLPHTALPNLTHLQIPPGFLSFFTGPLTEGPPRQALRVLDLMPYYSCETIEYVPVTNIPFDCLCGKGGASVVLKGVEVLKMRIDRYMQWNLGEWFPNLKELVLTDVSTASTDVRFYIY